MRSVLALLGIVVVGAIVYQRYDAYLGGLPASQWVLISVVAVSLTFAAAWVWKRLEVMGYRGEWVSWVLAIAVFMGVIGVYWVFLLIAET